MLTCIVYLRPSFQYVGKRGNRQMTRRDAYHFEELRHCQKRPIIRCACQVLDTCEKHALPNGATHREISEDSIHHSVRSMEPGDCLLKCAYTVVHYTKVTGRQSGT